MGLLGRWSASVIEGWIQALLSGVPWGADCGEDAAPGDRCSCLLTESVTVIQYLGEVVFEDID